MPIRRIGFALVGVALAVYVALMVGVRVNPPTSPPAPDTAPSGPSRAAPRGAIDYPTEGTPVLGAANVRGWALDESVQSGTGVDRVRVFLDGAQVAEANYGVSRQDISDRLGAQFENAGWTARLDLHGQAWGRHRLDVRAQSTLTGQETDYVSTLVIAPPVSAPRGALDAPTDGATLTPTSLDVRGWALDQVVEQGTGVDRVNVLVDDALVSQADYGVPRDDIGNQFGAQFEAVGWSAHVDLHGLATGNHRIEARAHSVFSDYETAYAASIVIAPPPGMPRGSIDTPNDGSLVTGATQIEGWALDQASTSGPGVDRVQLYLDGALVAEPTYGIPRPDIGAAYGAEFENTGWAVRVDVSGRSGSHLLEARVHSSYDDRETSYTTSVVISP